MSTIFYKEGVEYIFEKTSDNTECSRWLIDNFSSWEPFTFQCFRKVADSTKTAVDIGAWIGLTGIWLSKNFKTVICVEADKLSVDNLKANLRASKCDNYTIIPNAVYNCNTTLYFGPNSFRANSTLNESMSQLKSTSDKTDDYMVNTVTLNDIVKETVNADIGLLKVDIEGGEEHILGDLLSFSHANKIPVLLSLHISWWKDRNISRVSELFKNCTIESEKLSGGGVVPTSIAEHLQTYPFDTLFITYV